MTDSKAPSTNQLKNSTIAPALMAPVLGGAIIYYALRDTAVNDVAKFANRMSFVGFALWLAFYMGIVMLEAGHAVQETFRWGGTVVMVVGLVLAAVVTVRIRRSVS